MSERSLDWRAFVNRLVFCYGCGRFGVPAKGTAMPRGWSMLYQPHGSGPVGLHVCRDACKAKVQEALRAGPVLEPIEMASNITMSSEMREQMMVELLQHAVEEGLIDKAFTAALGEAALGEVDGENDEG